jgi:ribosomal protein L7/L12
MDDLIPVACALGGGILGLVLGGCSRPRDAGAVLRLERGIDALLRHFEVTPPKALPDEVRRLLAKRRTTAALAAYCEETGASLDAARDAILESTRVQQKMDALIKHLQAKEADPFSTDVIEAIRFGKKMEAVRRLRERTGLGLYDAKQAVDEWERCQV